MRRGWWSFWRTPASTRSASARVWGLARLWAAEVWGLTRPELAVLTDHRRFAQVYGFDLTNSPVQNNTGYGVLSARSSHVRLGQDSDGGATPGSPRWNRRSAS